MPEIWLCPNRDYSIFITLKFDPLGP